MGKVLWVDIETSGLDAQNCAILQLAAVVEINHQIIDELNLFVEPHECASLEPQAMEMAAKTPSPAPPLSPIKALTTFKRFLSRYVNKFDPLDKFVSAGYNIASFDDPFLRAFFTRLGDKYYGSWFFWPKRDVQTYLADFIAETPHQRLKNYKLETVCALFGIDIEAHNALSDIKATRQLYYTLRYSLAALRQPNVMHITKEKASWNDTPVKK